MKQLLIWIFERQLTLILFSNKVRLWIFEILESPVMRWRTGVNFQKMMSTTVIQKN
jgi:hypothetical protein